MRSAFVLLAAGSGERLGFKTPKALVSLGRIPLFLHSLIKAKEANVFDKLILVVPGEFENDFKDALSKHRIDVDDIVLGGDKRVDSVFNGLNVVSDLDYVFIHDAARPFLSIELIDSLLKESQNCSAVIPGLAINSTLKLTKEGFVSKTLDRDNICTVQTPQVFSVKSIKAALINLKESHISRDIPDDAYLLELNREKVKLIEGDVFNFKITYPQDLKFAERIFKKCK